MEGQNGFRRAVRGLAGDALGVPVERPRIWESQVAALTHETLMMSLPVDTSRPVTVLQDPVTGEPYFMAGLDPAGGDTPVGG